MHPRAGNPEVTGIPQVDSYSKRTQQPNQAKDRQIEDLLKAMNGNKPIGNNPRGTRWEKKDCGSYCHTHGYLIGPKHTSETCRQPGPNHNKQATRQNPMGSNMEGKPTMTT